MNLAHSTDAGRTITTAILISEDTVNRYNLSPAHAERVAQAVRDGLTEEEIFTDVVPYIHESANVRVALVGALAFATREAQRQIADLLTAAHDANIVR